MKRQRVGVEPDGSSLTSAPPPLGDIERSRERHILRFMVKDEATGAAKFDDLPIWSAVNAWSFGTLSKVIERGATGDLALAIADNLGILRSGFASRVKALVYLRNRCAHHSRLWHHSVIDSGQTPSKVRNKAKRDAGNFEPRSVLDVIASLDDILAKGMGVEPVLPELVTRCKSNALFWDGLRAPTNPIDHEE